MPKSRNRQSIPSDQNVAHPSTNGVLELDRFSSADLDRWNRQSAQLDRLHNLLHFGFESQRNAVRSQLTDALQAVEPCNVDLQGWCRIVPHRYSLDPLSPIGSLFSIGGRFNVGRDLPIDVRSPWSALYIASDAETAYREKYGIARVNNHVGLGPTDFALMPRESLTVAAVNGRIAHAFDLTTLTNLAPVCKAIGRFKMPRELLDAIRALRIPRGNIRVVRTPIMLHRAVMAANWRQWPLQFDVPALSQVLAGLILAAGYEAILYPSSKSGERCIAVFPQNLFHRESFIELASPAPPGSLHTRMDADNAADFLADCC